MGTLVQDVLYAMRIFRRAPGFTLAAVITLTLGVGATTAVFSVVHGVVLRPLPYEDPDELVTVWRSVPDRGNRLITLRRGRLAQLGSGVRLRGGVGAGAEPEGSDECDGCENVPFHDPLTR